MGTAAGPADCPTRGAGGTAGCWSPAADWKTAGGEAKRTRRVNLALSEDEYTRWSTAAGDRQLATWARSVVAGHLAAEKDRPGVAEEVAKVRTAMTRLGGNINQIARALNAETRGGPAVDRDAVAEDLARLRAGQDEVRELLRRLVSGR